MGAILDGYMSFLSKKVPHVLPLPVKVKIKGFWAVKVKIKGFWAVKVKIKGFWVGGGHVPYFLQ